MTPALEERLIDQFPSLFALNADWPEKGVTEHYPIACGDGWLTLIERTCLTLAELERRYKGFGCLVPWMPSATVFTDNSTGHEGLLRFDLRTMRSIHGTPLTAGMRRDELATGMCWMACEMSRDICEVCGNPGRYARKRVRCAAHLHVSTRDAEADAAMDVAHLVARALNPDAQATFTPIPTKKRKSRG
jgi:hypothetical protein